MAAWRRLCDWLTRQPPASGFRGWPGREDMGIGARLPASAGAPVPGRSRGCGVRLPVSAVPRYQPGSHRDRRRQCGRRPCCRGDAGDPPGRTGAAGLRLVHFALVDMEAIGETMSTKAEADPMVQRPGLLEMAGLYLGGADPRSPLAAPIYADLKGLAPLLIQVGAAETLLDDAIRLAKVGGAADVRVDLQIWPEMVHVWHMFHPELKAGKRALQAGGDYIRALMAR